MIHGRLSQEWALAQDTMVNAIKYISTVYEYMYTCTLVPKSIPSFHIRDETTNDTHKIAVSRTKPLLSVALDVTDHQHALLENVQD